jgi:SAM-dependent MidA family methyltransferase
MTRCLHDPIDGYYATRPALGAQGDFITSPGVSQMFGELIGLWLAETWRGMGEPNPVILAEAGPGDGALTADALRAARAAPEFLCAAKLWLLEASAPLRSRQAERLGAFAPCWASALGDIPRDRPLLFVANEFLDCLPARQYQRTAEGWAERVVGVSPEGGLIFGLRPAAASFDDAPAGTVLERSPAQEAFALELASRLAEQGGAALLIDYGPAARSAGDTLQAVRGHARIDPLACPGEADLTVHVDFPAVLAAARSAGANAALLTQAEFLRRLGIEARAARLAAARPDKEGVIARQFERLTAADQMGELFKAAAIWTGPAPPAFGDMP